MPTPDSKDLAQLVLACRNLREDIGEVMETHSLGNESAFLQAQINTEVGELQALLTRFRSSACGTLKEKKPGFLKALFRVEEPDLEQASFGLEGKSSSIPLTEMIGFLSSSGRTGVLWVYAQDEAFTIEFSNGEMTRALSDKTPKGLRLGEILVDQGALEDEDVERLVRAASEADAYFGTYLLENETVSESQLRGAFAVQVQSLFHRMNCAQNAIYRFQEDVDLNDAQALNLSVTGLLLECARREDEAQRATG